MNILNIRSKAISNNKKSFIQLAVMIFLTFITQVITLVKTSVTAANFGATTQMDAFNFSNSIGTFIFSFIGTGVTTVLIPAIINKKEKQAVNSFITILYGISIIFVVVIFSLRNPLITVFSSGSMKFIEIASNIILITLITQFFNTILGVTNAIFQCNGKFNIPKISTFITTLLLTFLVSIHVHLSIYDFVFYILITMILNVIIQIFFAYKEGFRYKPIVNISNPEVKSMIKIFIPTMFSAGVYQVSLLIDSLISSNLGEGKISILTYSNTIMLMINMLLIANIMTYIYPKITKSINKDNGQKVLFDYCTLFNALMCLIVVAYIIIGKDSIIILFQRGKFNENVTDMVYVCSIISIIGLPINIIRDCIYRYFYAKGNTKITFVNSLLSSAINIIFSIIFAKFIGVYGVILGTVIASVFSLTSILIRFKKEYGIKTDKKQLVKENFKIAIVSFFVLLISLIIKNNLIINNIILSIIVHGFIVVIIYILGLFIFRTKIHKIKL